MKLSRPSRLLAAVIALVSILFMQLAVAAYACPVLSADYDRAAITTMAAMPDGAMTTCDDADPVQPNLCHAYGQAGEQSLDKPAVASPQPFIAVGFGLPIAPFDTVHLHTLAVRGGASLAHASAPPVAIANCCFRI